jgi:uncharacterized repeat protein (TIGR03803 family)
MKSIERMGSAALALGILLASGMVFAPSARAQTEVIVHSFDSEADGSKPDEPLIRDREGNLYGVTGTGGTADLGTVFKIGRDGTKTILYSFTGAPDGQNPTGGLAWDREGNLIGTTAYGGDLTDCVESNTGCGTVFKLDPRRCKETVLYRFKGIPDGEFPWAGVTLDEEGNIYGTTFYGGTSGAVYSGGGSNNCCGTVFKLNRWGNETVLYSFTGLDEVGVSTDGQSPDGRLARDEEGNLYGTATRGGLSDEGILFKVDRTGKETVLHTFTGPDGADPLFVDLIFDRAGNLYGTTSGGGTSGNGTVFKVDRTGALTTLYSFNAAPDGALPSGALVFDAEGNLYGTTKSGSNAVINGESGVGGTVFKLDKAGNETVLHNFTGSPDGLEPQAGLIFDGRDKLYGTTVEGGTGTSCKFGAPFGCGTVFELTLPRP